MELGTVRLKQIIKNMGSHLIPAIPTASRVAVFAYHDVVHGTPGDDFAVSKPQFTEQVAALAALGTPVPISALLDAASLPDTGQPFSLTFDDGFASFVEVVLPIVERFQIPVMLAVTREYIGRQGYLSQCALQDLARTGWIEFASHGLTHRHLIELDVPEISKELVSSKQWLEDLTGRPVRYVVYPYGAYDSRCIQMAKAVGYEGGFTVIERRTAVPPRSPFEVERLTVFNMDSAPNVSRKLVGCYDWIGTLQLVRQRLRRLPSLRQRKYPSQREGL